MASTSEPIVACSTQTSLSSCGAPDCKKLTLFRLLWFISWTFGLPISKSYKNQFLELVHFILIRVGGRTKCGSNAFEMTQSFFQTTEKLAKRESVSHQGNFSKTLYGSLLTAISIFQFWERKFNFSTFEERKFFHQYFYPLLSFLDLIEKCWGYVQIAGSYF